MKANSEQRTANVETLWGFGTLLSRLGAALLIFLVRVYRVTLSPAKTFLFGPAGQCRFEPSCSRYAIEALKSHGALAGGLLAAKRVCRCHPWGECGEDPVPVVKGRDRASEVGI